MIFACAVLDDGGLGLAQLLDGALARSGAL